MEITIPKYLSYLKPYTAGELISKVQRQYGIDTPIKLASNENPLGASPKAIEAVKMAIKDIHRYPDTEARLLRCRLASFLKVKRGQIVVGNGSDEIMGLIGQAFLLAGEEVIIPCPCFSIYEKVALMAQANLVKVPLKDLAINLEAIKKRISKDTKLIFLTNPFNPSGSFFGAGALEEFLRSIPKTIIIMLDEAYIEFVSLKKRYESIYYLKSFSNLIILRTFSKAYGLAGLRIGYGIMEVQLASLLDKVRHPFNINSLAQIAAISALEDRSFLEKTCKLVWQGRQFLTKALRALGVRVYESEANFLLIYVGRKAQRIYKGLLKKGIIIRPLTSYGLRGYLRISVGKPEENKAFIKSFKEIWQK
jgi:histidinol-phosphate aminotransferase